MGNGTSAFQTVAPGSNGNVLASNGTTWTSAAPPSPAALSTASGSAPSYSARAWVNFNGTGTVAIRASFNVSSITDGGTGTYTVNFTNAMPDANYSATALALWTGGPYIAVPSTSGSYSTTSIGILTGTSTAGALTDVSAISVAIFR